MASTTCNMRYSFVLGSIAHVKCSELTGRRKKRLNGQKNLIVMETIKMRLHKERFIFSS